MSEIESEWGCVWEKETENVWERRNVVVISRERGGIRCYLQALTN